MPTNIGHNKNCIPVTFAASASVSSAINLKDYGGGLMLYVPTTKDDTSVILGFLGLKGPEGDGFDPDTDADYARICDDSDDGALIEQGIPTEDRLYVIRPEILPVDWLKLVLLTSGSVADAQTAASTFYLKKLG